MVKPRIKVRYIGEDNPLMLRHGKEYEAIVGDHGWYSIIDETHEEYAYPPRLFEIIEAEGTTTASKRVER